jgi:outer membrane protein insertion porin family
MDIEFYTNIFANNVLAFALHGKQITSTQLEFSDFYPIGGTNSIRGYRENQFFAQKTFWLNSEYRFLTGRLSSFFSFVDAGYFERPDDAILKISTQKLFLYGYGLGAKVESAVGILSISFALGKGDSFSQTKIHVGLINEF